MAKVEKMRQSKFWTSIKLTPPEFRVLWQRLVFESSEQGVDSLLLDVRVRSVLTEPLAQLLAVVVARQGGLNEITEHSGKIFRMFASFGTSY